MSFQSSLFSCSLTQTFNVQLIKVYVSVCLYITAPLCHVLVIFFSFVTLHVDELYGTIFWNRFITEYVIFLWTTTQLLTHSGLVTHTALSQWGAPPCWSRETWVKMSNIYVQSVVHKAWLIQIYTAWSVFILVMLLSEVSLMMTYQFDELW